MPKYEVTLKETEIYRFEVEADNAGSALDTAYELLDSDKKQSYHQDSDGESEVNKL